VTGGAGTGASRFSISGLSVPEDPGTSRVTLDKRVPSITGQRRTSDESEALIRGAFALRELPRRKITLWKD